MEIVDITSPAEARSMRASVLAAYVDGEHAEQLLRVAALIDGRAGTPPTSAIESSRRLIQRWSGAARHVDRWEVDKLARSTSPFVAGLDGLPGRLRIDGLGTCEVVATSTRAASATWDDRLADADQVTAVYHEVRDALAGLTRARMQLDLAVSRLDRVD